MSRVFFTDRDLGKQFPDILASAGLVVERHRDHFPPDCADEVWLGVVGARGWVALTHNSRIRYTPNELRAVMEHSVALLVLVGKSRHVEIAHSFIATLAHLCRVLQSGMYRLYAVFGGNTTAFLFHWRSCAKVCHDHRIAGAVGLFSITTTFTGALAVTAASGPRSSSAIARRGCFRREFS